MPLTPDERAEKIWDFVDDYQNTDNYLNEWKGHIVPFIAAEIRAAVDDARAIGHAGCRAEAYEAAATLVESRKGIPEHHSDLAALIRARAKEIGGPDRD